MGHHGHTRRRRLARWLAVGGGFLLASAVAAIMAPRLGLWGTGAFAFTALAQTIGLLALGSAVLEVAPPGPRLGAFALAAGAASVALGVVLAGDAGPLTPPVDAAFFLSYPLFVLGFGLVALGAARLIEARPAHGPRFLPGGFRSFVAWRYLLVFEIKVTVAAGAAVGVGLAFLTLSGVSARFGFGLPASPSLIVATASFLAVTWAWGILRHTRAGFLVFVGGVILVLGCLIGIDVVRHTGQPTVFGELDPLRQVLLQVFDITKLVGAGLALLALFFGTLRAFFTFFTTVPIGGVWIGTAALVMVLAVMSGFETDLRDKILGSNAHIQITREDGEFVEWRAIKDKIDRIPGVVASTPYAVSEVVIAAHNNGMNVIIKGIDPETVGRVTDLVADLEDPSAMSRLEPLVDDADDLSVPQAPGVAPADVVDPAPPDMPSGGEPIDFSGAEPVLDGADGDPASGAGAGPQLEAPADFGGDAEALPDEEEAPAAPGEVVDPPPADLVASDEPPVDYSTPDAIDDSAIRVLDVPIDASGSRRTQSLPGVLVGRELVKQTHLYPGEEVRIVSPLSDPSNPDATGTPIPFNRDYRVAGIFFTGMYEYDLKYVYVTLESLQDFLDRGDAIDGIEVRIIDPDDTERYVPTEAGPGLIRQALGPGYRVVDWRELNRSLFSALKLEKIAMFLVLGIVILVASFSIVGNLIMVVVEKGREIALLKTLGASDFSVMQLFSIQGLMIGLIGTVLGVATGLAGCWAGKRFGLPLNPDVYYIDKLPIHVDPQSVAAAAAAGILISIAATLYPALLAARVRPAAGMRH